jgi:sorbitol-specific phosphotransferase system component IIA
MKKLLLLPLLILLAFSELTAQVTVSLGTYTGAGSTNVLLSTSTTANRYSRTISVYTAAEIIAAGGMSGNITSLAWSKSGNGEYLTNDAYIKVYLKHVSNSVWNTSPVPDWNTEVQGATEVFTSSNYSIPTGTGWKTVPFTTAFSWNGTDNIAVFVEWDRSSAPTGGDISWGRSSDPNTNASRVGSTSLAALVMLINSNRPLVQFTIVGGPPPAVTAVDVFTLNNVPATITTNAGTLQMDVDVLPATVSQNVTWSIVPVTGAATISTTGLITAQSNGIVWAKAVSVQDPTKSDSLLITISNQLIPITSVDVFTLNNVAATITTNGGTLQMDSDVLPVTANQNVTWSIVAGTGAATISTTGLITASANGTVWAKAVSVQDATKSDSILVTISNQIVPITAVDVFTLNNVPATITTNGGSLQMDWDVLPATAVQTVTWSMIAGTGDASISTSGLVTAVSNGTVWAKAVSVQDPGKSDSLLITISNQVVPVTGISVFTLNNVPATINTNGGTLQMASEVLPATAVQDVTWSIVPMSGSANISAGGLITALGNGTVYAKAVSDQDPNYADSLLVTISNQVAPINSVDVSTAGNIPAIINVPAGTLQLEATVLPAESNQSVSWSIVPVTGAATISTSGLVTAVSNGVVRAKAVSVQDNSKSDSLLINISNQDVSVTEIIGSDELRLYPNPATSGSVYLELSTTLLQGNCEILISDIHGRIVQRVQVTQQVTRINTTSLTSGVYLLRLSSARGTAERKFTVN